MVERYAWNRVQFGVLMILRVWTILAIVISGSHFLGQNVTSLPAYVPAHRVTGTIRSWGSPQMATLMKLWESGFRRVQPGVEFEDRLKGTASAVGGLYAERADIALLGRDIWPAEIQAFASIEGYGPTTVQVATGSFDVPKATYALMVFVQKENPLTQLSLAHLAEIFGSDDVSSEGGPSRWGEVGLTGGWADRPIHRYAFNLENDKALVFRGIVFSKTRRWDCRIHEFSDSVSGDSLDAGQQILNALGKDRYGIAISNVHYSTPDTKVLALSKHKDGPFISPTKETVQSREYPLARSIHIVINRDPGKPLDPDVLEFLRYVLSREGQHDVVSEGNYLSLTDELVRSERKALGIE
ncbi:MAG TPA: substrate-binding domain-containing protein [Acidobacteriaceae bacterium]